MHFLQWESQLLKQEMFLNFAMPAESLNKITFSLQISLEVLVVFLTPVSTVLFISLKSAHLAKDMLDRLFSRPLHINFIRQAFLFSIIPALL